MRAVIQRVNKAGVKVDGQVKGQISKGLMVLLAVHRDDEEAVIQKMAEKIINLRIFNDAQNKMNLPVKDIDGEILVVSQFTLYGDCKKGNRPSYIESAKGDKAILFYNKFVSYIREQGIQVAQGEFGAEMAVELVNDGPVTIIIDI